MKILRPKHTSYPSASLKTVNLLDYTLWTENYLMSGGAYRSVLSVSTQSVFYYNLTGALSMHYSQGAEMLFVYTTAGIYRLKRGVVGLTQVLSGPPARPFFVDTYINGVMSAVCFSGTRRVVITADGFTASTDTRSFSTGVIHCGRFFGVDSADGLRLCWSQSTPLEWEEGIYGSGYIRLPAEGGKILRLFSYEDRLIAMREKGITVIHAYGEPQHYKVDATANYLIAGGIIADTCTICAGRIFFCACDGVYSFDGSAITAELNFTDCGVSSPLDAAACGTKYLFRCTHDVLGENVIYYYDKALGRGCVCNLSVDVMIEGPDNIYLSHGRVIRLLKPGGDGAWYSRGVRFGDGGRALLRSVDVDCDGDVTLTVSSLGVTRKLKGAGRHIVNMYGDAFTFSVESDGALRALTARAEE